MNVLKTIFTRCFVIWLGLVVIYASFQIIRGAEPPLSWIGLNLTALSLLPFFFTYLNSNYLRGNNLKGDNLKSDSSNIERKQTLAYTLVSGLGLVICMAISYRYQQAAGMLHIGAGATFIGWVIFVRFCLTK